MSDANSANDANTAAPDAPELEAEKSPPLWQRLLYMLGFAFLAYLAFWAILLLSALQFIFVALNSDKNNELAGFTRNLLLYLGEALGFIAFMRDERPFPFGPFPKANVEE